MTPQPCKVVAIVQARMSSTRLPGKVLLDIAGQPMLARVVERVRRAASVDQVVVATTTDPKDDAVEVFCKERSYPYIRGSLNDVLDRFYQAARKFGADVVVRITADCPVIDPGVIDATVAAFWGFAEKAQPKGRNEWKEALTGEAARSPAYDFAASRLPPPWKRTYPIGLDVEVCSFHGLERAWKEATAQYEREHVMPYFYDQEGRFRYTVINHAQDFGSMRWTVDTSQDLELIQQIYARFPGRDDFSWFEILELVLSDESLGKINAGTHHKNVYEVDQAGTHHQGSGTHCDDDPLGGDESHSGNPE